MTFSVPIVLYVNLDSAPTVSFLNTAVLFFFHLANQCNFASGCEVFLYDSPIGSEAPPETVRSFVPML
jgi:hypothetical protein